MLTLHRLDSAGHEIVPDVEGIERQRKPGEPAFLKPLPFKDFLPSLITILHSIPGCRSAMLANQDLLLHYGHPGQWWSGESVEVPRTIGPDYDANREGMFDMVNEVQRLMAFLDKTNRSYGSAAALARLPALNESHAMEDHSVRFLKAWRKASAVLQSDSSQQPLFVSTTAPEGQREPDVVHMVNIAASDLPNEPGETLYDVLDKSLWQGSATGSRPGAWLENVAPVLALRLPTKMLPAQRHGTDLSVDIPGILFADRYHVSNKEIMLDMHKELESARAGIKSIDEALAKIETFSSSALSKPGSAGDLLSVASKHIQTQLESEESGTSSTDETMSTAELSARLQAISTQLGSRITGESSKSERTSARRSTIDHQADLHSTQRTTSRCAASHAQAGEVTDKSRAGSRASANHAVPFVRGCDCSRELCGDFPTVLTASNCSFVGGRNRTGLVACDL